MPAPALLPATTQMHTPRYGSPKVLPPQPQQHIPEPPYERTTSTDNYPCTDPSPRSCSRLDIHENYPVRFSLVRAPHSPVTSRLAVSLPQGSQPSSSRQKTNLFVPRRSIFYRSSGISFFFHQLTNLLGINTEHGINVQKWLINIFSSGTYTQVHIESTCKTGQLKVCMWKKEAIETLLSNVHSSLLIRVSQNTNGKF